MRDFIIGVTMGMWISWVILRIIIFLEERR